MFRKSLLALPFLFSSAALAAKPTEFLQKQVLTVRSLIAEKAKSSDASSFDGKLMTVIEPVMEFDKLSERALRKHWPTLTPEQQKQFTETFRQLVFRSYLNRVDSAGDAYTIEYEGEEAKSRTQASVQAVAKTRKAEIELVFQLEKRGDTWVAEDVVIDEVSLTENYREQFNKIIADEGFAGLIKKMNDKLEKAGGPVKSAPLILAPAPVSEAAPASAAAPATK